MKYLKLFEENITKPKLNDYVVCSPDEIDCHTFEQTVKLQKHVSQNPGQIVKIYPTNIDPYEVKFNFGPDNPYRYTFVKFRLDEILYHNQNIENCETFIQATKYNL